METKKEESTKDYVRKVTVKYVGPRRKSAVISCPGEAARFIRSVLNDEAREHLVALYLDSGHRVISLATVSTGCATSAPVHPREVFQPAILSGACALIVGHNHPSGNPTPSLEDLHVTRRLAEAGKLLSISLLDHAIVAEDGYIRSKSAAISDAASRRAPRARLIKTIDPPSE